MSRRPNAARQTVKLLGDLGLGQGTLAGALLTAPLVGVMYLLDHWAGLPFIPFALFDWIARVLPGPVVTFGIDMMIDGIRLVGMSVADAAKTAEQIMAVVMFFFIGVAAIALFFSVLKSRNIAPRPFAGLVVGLLLGLPMTVVGLDMGQSTLDPALIILGIWVPIQQAVVE